MRLSELSERAGVSLATIKYYLREGLLPPGERVSATQADYGSGHLRRLLLVRALIQVGRVPVAGAREVLATVDDDTRSPNERQATAVRALPLLQGFGSQEERMEAAVALTVLGEPLLLALRRLAVAEKCERRGWRCRRSRSGCPPALRRARRLDHVRVVARRG
ncbi:DNA-binding transcriptional MerR regulator [Streptomyces griseochromogenes]|uniref:DNA-binding transcriptional MerR regulator n=1 Tax=Streptomyces griseochromogenes TaxID=68214 RepID=A0ABS4LR30_9ACTN|nr:MerR family transcriptional regulator [Streptomyces griseochromogenes]MBP2049813.1 DNA-binding transcriptional MerR regulator [Streptomyces griseochromogenes]